MRHAVALGLLVLVTGCASTRPSERAESRPETEYRIGREDVLEVVVWREPELTRVVPVRPDGRISLPIAGEIEAAGKTPGELQVELTRSFEPFIKDTQVAVLVREVNGPRVYVLGEVARPGGFPLRGNLEVVQAIALAGGRTEFAKDEVIWLRSRSDGPPERITLSFDELVRGAHAGSLWLRAGDVIYVR